MPNPSYVLVTGSTGFIGAHVVDNLLSRGIKVRGATRTKAKGDEMIKKRPQHKGQLDFVEVADFEGATSLDEAVKDVDAVIHVASPFRYDTTNNETQLVLPAINGVKSLLRSASQSPNIQRVVVTSSFAAIMDASIPADPSSAHITYTAADWNPLTYAESVAASTSPVVAYRGSKKYAELAAWTFVRELQHQHQHAHDLDAKPPLPFDLVAICPPLVFGPLAHHLPGLAQLNESNAALWRAATGAGPLPTARVPLWVDVRDVACAHVEALLREEAGGKRYAVVAPEKFSYGLVAGIVRRRFPGMRAEGEREEEERGPGECYGLDGETAGRELGVRYRGFEETVVDLVEQLRGWREEGEGEV